MASIIHNPRYGAMRAALNIVADKANMCNPQRAQLVAQMLTGDSAPVLQSLRANAPTATEKETTQTARHAAIANALLVATAQAAGR